MVSPKIPFQKFQQYKKVENRNKKQNKTSKYFIEHSNKPQELPF